MSKKKKKAAAPEKASSPASPPDPGGALSANRARMALALILAGSFLLSFAAIAQFKECPYFTFPIVDEQSYVNWAGEISAGGNRPGKVFYQDPLYPYSLAALFKIFGVPVPNERHAVWYLIRFIQAFLVTGSIYLVYLAAARIGGDKAGLAAAAALALHRGMYFFMLQIEKATMTTFLSAASCLFGVLAAERPERQRYFLGCGLTLGLLTLLRGNFLPILPLLVIGAFWTAKSMPPGKRLGRAAVMAAGIILIILPVSLRNYIAAGEFVLTTSQGGANFYIGNSEYAKGGGVEMPFVRAHPEFEAIDFQAEAEKRAGRKLAPAEVSRFWFRESFNWMKANPGKAIALTLHKARLMVNQYEIPDNYSLIFVRREYVSMLWLPIFGFGLLWGPALLGMWAFRRDVKASYPAAFALLYCLSIIPFFIVDRYRTAAYPSLALFSGLFFHWAISTARKEGTKKLIPYAAALAVCLFIGLWPVPESKLKKPMGMAYFSLGEVYLNSSEPAKALEFFDRALEYIPDSADARTGRDKAKAEVEKNRSGNKIYQ